MPRAVARGVGSDGEARVCAEVGCRTRLSVYNEADRCSLHHPTEVLRTRGRHIA